MVQHVKAFTTMLDGLSVISWMTLEEKELTPISHTVTSTFKPWHIHALGIHKYTYTFQKHTIPLIIFDPSSGKENIRRKKFKEINSHHSKNSIGKEIQNFLWITNLKSHTLPLFIIFNLYPSFS